MQRALDQLFKDAVNRKPKRLSFDTTYSHGNIYDWLQTILTDWTIIIPGSSCSEFALSNWPANGFTRNGVKQWLEEKNHQKPDDLIDGACEPLAYYLSSSISQLNLSSIIELSEDQESRRLTSIYEQVKNGLDQLEPRLAAELISENYIKQEVQSPQFWHESFGNSYKNFLFGHPLAEKRLLEMVATGDNTKVIPLYVLCYLFDNNELTNAELKNIKEESAQYSLHAIGLVINSLNKTVIIADPNGALIGGSNMEFLRMPLTKLNSKPTTTTTLSCFDRMERTQTIKIKEELHAERKAEGLPAKRARIQ